MTKTTIAEKLILALRMRVVEYIDLTLLPAYQIKRDEVFEKLGYPTPPLIYDEESDELFMQDLPVDPNHEAMQILHKSITAAVWSPREGGFASGEYIIGDMAMQPDEYGAQEVIVLLKDRFSEEQEAIPLQVLLSNFKPLEPITFSEYHS